MIKRTLLLSVLMVVVVPSFGHQAIFVQDADGDRLGELIDNFLVQDMVVLTSDGYLMNIDVNTGKFRAISLSDLRYETDNCTGQAYMSGGSFQGPFLSGGHVLEVNNAVTTPSFVRIDYFPTHVGIDALSTGKLGACNPLDVFIPDVIPVTPIELPAYNIKQIGPDTWGFKKPFSVTRELQDGIFCNSFEDCPTP